MIETTSQPDSRALSEDDEGRSPMYNKIDPNPVPADETSSIAWRGKKMHQCCLKKQNSTITHSGCIRRVDLAGSIGSGAGR